MKFYRNYFLVLSFAAGVSAVIGADTALADAHKKSTAESAPLSPLPAGVREIKLSEFFKMPIGPHGLEPSEKLLGMNNQRVRLVGYQVKEEEPAAGLFMLSSNPVALSEVEDGPADDLPAATVFVHMPEADAAKIVAYRPGPWMLTGTLQVGNQEESNGRISFVRLLVEKPTATASR